MELKSFYIKIRLDNDTLKTICRLSILGVIEYYTIQYPTLATVICKKLSETEILNNLERYVERYLTRISAQAVRTDAPSRNQPTMLRKCVDYLIDFTYDKVFDKRKKALGNIEATGVADPSEIPALLVMGEASIHYRVDAVICPADVVNVTQFIAESEDAERQVACADIILLSKTESVPEQYIGAVQNMLDELNPFAALYISKFGLVNDVDVLTVKASENKQLEKLIAGAKNNEHY